MSLTHILQRKYEQNIYFDDLTITHEHSPIVAGGDYYPFGLPIVDRQITQENYSYGYQGQFNQKDTVTQWNMFDLRMYDPAIGRWSSPDVVRQFHSGFIGMGNNPVNFFDPDGAWVIFANKADALKVAADINRIFRARFNLDYDVISVVDQKIKGQKSFGGKLATNSKFDWDTSEHTKALFDVINVEESAFVSIVDETILDPAKLGYTHSSSKITLSNQLPIYPSKHGVTLGSTAIHELTYHLHGEYSTWLYPKKTSNGVKGSNIGYYYWAPVSTTVANPFSNTTLSVHKANGNNFIGKIVVDAAKLAVLRIHTGAANKLVRTPRYRH
jgi:RHS repeat-associated protein